MPGIYVKDNTRHTIERTFAGTGIYDFCILKEYKTPSKNQKNSATGINLSHCSSIPIRIPDATDAIIEAVRIFSSLCSVKIERKDKKQIIIMPAKSTTPNRPISDAMCRNSLCA